MDDFDELLGSDRSEGGCFWAIAWAGFQAVCIGVAIIWVPLLLFFLAFVIF